MKNRPIVYVNIRYLYHSYLLTFPFVLMEESISVSTLKYETGWFGIWFIDSPTV